MQPCARLNGEVIYALTSARGCGEASSHRPFHPPPPALQPHTASQPPPQLGRHLLSTALALLGLLFLLLPCCPSCAFPPRRLR